MLFLILQMSIRRLACYRPQMSHQQPDLGCHPHHHRLFQHLLPLPSSALTGSSQRAFGERPENQGRVGWGYQGRALWALCPLLRRRWQKCWRVPLRGLHFCKKRSAGVLITKITNSASVRIRTLWCSEVDDVSIGLEHVHLLNCLNGLHVQLLKCGLELLVVDARAFRLALNFPSWGSLPAGASCQNLSYYGNYQRVCMGSRS